MASKERLSHIDFLRNINLSVFCGIVVKEINIARNSPEVYLSKIKVLKKLLLNSKDKKSLLVGKYKTEMNYTEGVEVFDEAIIYLSKKKFYKEQ